MMKRKENSSAQNVICACHNIVMIQVAVVYQSISNMGQGAHTLRQKKEWNTKMHVEGALRIASRVIAGVNFAGDMYLDYANAH